MLANIIPETQGIRWEKHRIRASCLRGTHVGSASGAKRKGSGRALGRGGWRCSQVLTRTNVEKRGSWGRSWTIFCANGNNCSVAFAEDLGVSRGSDPLLRAPSLTSRSHASGKAAILPRNTVLHIRLIQLFHLPSKPGPLYRAPVIIPGLATSGRPIPSPHRRPVASLPVRGKQDEGQRSPTLHAASLAELHPSRSFTTHRIRRVRAKYRLEKPTLELVSFSDGVALRR